jgi:AraC-like DNA-binding protein
MPHRLRTPRRDLPGPMGAILIEVAADFGLSAAAVLDGTSIDEAALSAPDTRISIRDEVCMLDNCLRLSGRPDFALHFGSRISVAALGVLGYALMCCRNVKELMEMMGQYHRLISGSFRIEVSSGRDPMAIRLLGGMLETAVQPADCEIFFAASAASLRQLCSLSEDALQVTLAYPDPGYGAAYRELICADIRFDAPDNRLAVDRRYLDMPLQFANPTLLKLYRQQCDQMLAAMDRSAALTEEIRHYLLGNPGRFAGFEEAAEHFHMSPRTLRRRLDEEGTTYQRIVHELRKQLAETYLRDSMLSIAEIAYMLGYHDLSNFRRAFISWTGRSPSACRRGMRGGPRQAGVPAAGE